MYRRTINIIVVSSLMGFLATLAVAFRLLAKYIRAASMGTDDYLAIVGLVRTTVPNATSSADFLTHRYCHWESLSATLSAEQLGALAPTKSCRPRDPNKGIQSLVYSSRLAR